MRIVSNTPDAKTSTFPAVSKTWTVQRSPSVSLEISFLSSLCYQNETFAPKREFGTESEDAWSMVSIDRAARRIKVFRRGAGEDFSAAY